LCGGSAGGKRAEFVSKKKRGGESILRKENYEWDQAEFEKVLFKRMWKVIGNEVVG